MELFLILFGFGVGAFAAWNVAQRKNSTAGGQWREQAEGVVFLLQHVNARLPGNTANAVYGVAMRACRGEFRDYVETRLELQPTPPEPPVQT
ncbi:hypothetical protein KZZ52_31525 [Dactylosporangium sp. AC04546]|uniref:hypothetical protein n=1 Tax=Dactylosporangium sp. AC04546 TaxID=2862460 RepID=UPI001EE04267|nr:hypothetical protein [Dactylosporangium sp. AC04546]WVK78524.1 hypothetical protein KZZ52_31525 [Dactylosporangium sp. AC04546]